MNNHLRLSSAALNCYHQAINSAKSRHQAFVTPLHMALAIIEDDDIKDALNYFGVSQLEVKSRLMARLNPGDLLVHEKHPSPPTHNAELMEIMEQALKISDQKPAIELVDIFLAILSDNTSVFSLYMLTCGVDFRSAQEYFSRKACLQGGDAS